MEQLLNEKELKEVQGKIKFNVYFKEGARTTIHNDIDGLLCGALFNNIFDIKINGIFNLNSQANMDSTIHSENKKILNNIFLDCSILKQGILSIDHHYSKLKAWGKDSINCNKYNHKSKDIDVYGSFLHKMPMGNILWLMYLLQEDISKYTYQQQLLLIMADSFHINYLNSRYMQNCIDWLKLFNMECLIDTLNKPSLLKDIEELKAQLGFSGNGYQVFSGGVFKSHQTSKTTQEVLNNITELMGWKECKLPSFFYVHKFSNSKQYSSNINSIMADKYNFTSAIREIGRNPIMYVSRYIGTEEL
ncbi:hypothetical protein [Clostridium scatologenes]|uniref:Uncharacterized protein n=1 Tax=Clostridium scatologenes TaxID=1548 RepID=A0A0E3K3G2_CLOSL|nr:hypothetical protein [Clostridium scatologenes]AKA71224.1 hypothetical protein CSCA_4099 [Clostridium scatologenes]